MPLPGRPFEKGREKTGGRKPGVQNKTTAAVKAALLRALEADSDDGGEEFFAGLRETDPRTFASLVSKLIASGGANRWAIIAVLNGLWSVMAGRLVGSSCGLASESFAMSM